MDIRIKKTQEMTKGGFLSVPTLKLTLEVTALLNQAEKALTQRYGDPKISHTDLSQDCENPVDAQMHIDFEKLKGESLTTFHIMASVEGGEYLGLIQQLERSAVRSLTRNVGHLETLAAWEGENLLTNATDERDTDEEPTVGG